MVGTICADGDPVALDRRQRRLGVEPLHHHDCSAAARARQRTTSAARRGRSAPARDRRRRRDPKYVRQQGGEAVAGLVDLNREQARLDALGPAGRAGRVEHFRAAGLIGQPGPASPAARRRTGTRRPRRRRRTSARPPVPGRRVPRPRSATPAETITTCAALSSHDVGRLVRRQVPVHGGDVEAGTDCRPVDLERLGSVVGQHGDDVAVRSPRCVQRRRQRGRSCRRARRRSRSRPTRP